MIPLVEFKEALDYAIPSFSVITVDVRRVRYQVILEDGSAAIVDGLSIGNQTSQALELYCKINQSLILVFTPRLHAHGRSR